MEQQRDNTVPGSRDAFDLKSDLGRVTLVFHNPDLESRYRIDMNRQTMPVVRFGISLAVILYLLFAVLDWWTASEQVAITWAIRAGVVLFTGILFALTFHDVFVAYREALMSLFATVLALGLTAIFSVVPPVVVDQYYAGYLLIIVGTFTVFGLRFPNAAVMSLLITGIYLWSEYMFRDLFAVRTVNNAMFLVSAIIVAGVGGYAGELQRRLAYFRLQVIEHDRAISEHSALHDPLTGLANRRLLMEKLGQAVARDARFDTHCSVLFIDLDAFKPVNDEHGHVFGDKLLKSVALRLIDCVRDTDTVARLGGDEFVVLLEDLTDREQVLATVNRILASFDTPCDVDGTPVPVEISIGQASHPGDGHTARELLEAADKAMYRMKRSHGRR